MPTNVRELLDPLVLTESYRQREGIKPTPLTDMFFVNPETALADTWEFFYDPADDQAAPLNHPGAEARIVQIGDGQERRMSLFTVFNKTHFADDVMHALREHGSRTLQQKGRSEISRIMGKFVERHRTLKELIIARVLTDGVVYYDGQGRVLSSSSGAAGTADFGVPAGNKGTIGGLIGESELFDNPSADIPEILSAIDESAEAASVPIPTDVWVHRSNIPGLTNNLKYQTWAVRNPAHADAVLNGGIVENLWGKTWHFVGHRYDDPITGSSTPYIPTTKAILTPPPNSNVFRAVNGVTNVPSDIGISSSWEEALNSVQEMVGQYAYAKLVDDPIKLIAYVGDKFLFALNEPQAIWQATAFGYVAPTTTEA